MIDEHPYIPWSCTLSPDQWERWRQLADLYQEFHGTNQEVALQAAYETMAEETSPASDATQRAVYAVLDLETGSLNPETGAIGSVAVMTLDREFAEVVRYYRLVADERSDSGSSAARHTTRLGTWRRRRGSSRN